MSITVRGLTIRAGDATLLDGVDLDLPAGRLVALLGPNGAGKSTLLRAVVGRLKPTAGEIRVGDRSARSLTGQERAAQLAWLPQRGDLLEPITALELVAAARFRFPESRPASLAAARRALEEVAADGLAERTMDRLSGGEAQRVQLAALMAQEARFLLLDEPGNHLDPAHQVSLYRFVGRTWRAGRGVLCVTHDVNLLAHVAPPDQAAEVGIVGLAEGRVLFRSHLADVALGDHLSSLYGLEIRRIEIDGRPCFVPVGP